MFLLVDVHPCIVNRSYLLLIMYASTLLKFYKYYIHNADSVIKNTIFVAEIVPNNYLNVTNMEKIVLEFTQSEIDAIFDCMIGSRSLDGSCTDLVNYVAKYSKGSGFYCSNCNGYGKS